MASGISYLKYTESGCNWNTTFSITNIYEVSYDIASNTSIVHVDFQSVNTGTRWDGTTRPNAGILRVDVDGQQTTCAVSLTKGMTTGDGRVLGSGSANFTISHNTDGSRSVTYSIRMEEGTDPNNYNCVWQTTDWSSGTLKLTTIPRTSNVSLNKSACTLNGGDGFVIYTNRASSSFSHNIYHNIGGSWVLIASGVGDNYTWIPSTNFYANIGNGSGTYKILCETYSGSTHIGDSEASFTLNSAGVHQCSLNIGSIVLNGSNSVRIYTNRNSTSFLHYIEQDFSGTMAGINSDYNCTDYLDWTPPLSLYNTIAGSSKSFTIRVHCKNNNGTYLGYTDVSFKITSAGADIVSMSSTNMTMEAKYSVNIAKKVDAFRHTISWSFGSQSGILGTEKAVDASVDWTPVIGLSSEIPSAMIGSGTVTCETYYGTTLIGSTTVNFNLSVPDYNVILSTPTITEEGTDAKTPANNLTTYGIGDTEVVAIMSIKRLVVNATTSYNATISNISVTFGSKTLDTSKNDDKSAFNNTFSGMLNGILSITATDSRGRTLASTYSQTYTFRNYFLPSVTAFSGDRTTQTSDTGTLNANGTFWNATAGTTANTVTGAISQSATGTAALTKTDNTWTTSYAVTGVTYTNSYPFTITITDSFGNKATKTYTLPVSVPIMWKGKHTVRIKNHLIVDRVIKAAKGVFTESVTAPTATFTGTVTAPTFNGNLQGNADTATNATKLLPSGDNSLAYWHSLSQGSYFARPNILTSQPSDYGMIMITRFGDDVCVLWKGQQEGALFIKGVNGGNVDPWRQVMDTSNLLDHVYPVGSIYFQVGTTTSPASLFGGSWAALVGDWRMILAGPASSGNGYTGGKLTTESTTLTANQSGLRSHSHNAYARNYTTNLGGSTENAANFNEEVGSWGVQNTGGWSAAEGHNHSLDWQPYITVTAWKRTA